VGALSEEHAGRTVKLRYDYALGSVYDEGAFLGHVRNRAEINILDYCCKVLVVRVGAIEFEFGFERHAICEAALQTLFDSVAGRVDIIVEKLQHEVVAGIGYRKILGKNLIEALIISFFGRGIELKEIAERLQLDLEKVGMRERVLYRRKIDTGFNCVD